MNEPSGAVQRWSATLALVVPLALGACTTRKDEPVSTTTTTSAVVVSNAEAIAHLMEARCTREAECRGAERERSESDHAACLDAVGSELRARLNAVVCPLGLERTRLDACLQQLRTRPCVGPLDSFAQFEGCREAALCARPSAP